MDGEELDDDELGFDDGGGDDGTSVGVGVQTADVQLVLGCSIAARRLREAESLDDPTLPTLDGFGEGENPFADFTSPLRATGLLGLLDSAGDGQATPRRLAGNRRASAPPACSKPDAPAPLPDLSRSARRARRAERLGASAQGKQLAAASSAPQLRRAPSRPALPTALPMALPSPEQYPELYPEQTPIGKMLQHELGSEAPSERRQLRTRGGGREAEQKKQPPTPRSAGEKKKRSPTLASPDGLSRDDLLAGLEFSPATMAVLSSLSPTPDLDNAPASTLVQPPTTRALQGGDDDCALESDENFARSCLGDLFDHFDNTDLLSIERARSIE